jgi:hypothetical protein
MLKKLVGYISEFVNEIVFRNGFWIGYSEGFEQGCKDTEIALGVATGDE